jgi:hypothetical protein
VNGVARGFRNSAWKDIPLMARAAPARNETLTLGILSLQKISLSFPPEPGWKIASSGVIFIPTRGAKARANRADRTRVSRIRFFLFRFNFSLSFPGG